MKLVQFSIPNGMVRLSYVNDEGVIIQGKTRDVRYNDPKAIEEAARELRECIK